MKMKELEELTGVGRETIRYYIREGLLPEPEKPKRNVAIYSDEHKNRLRLIKKLQDERFLPLNVIKEILDNPEGGKQRVPGLAGLEFALSARMGGPSEKVSIADLIDETGIEPEDIDAMIADGVIDILGNGARMVSNQDARIVRLWVALREAGFDDSLGYAAQNLERYQKAAQELAESEVEDFFDHVSGKRSTAEAAQLAEAGLGLVEEIFSILHLKAVIRETARRNAREMKG